MSMPVHTPVGATPDRNSSQPSSRCGRWPAHAVRRSTPAAKRYWYRNCSAVISSGAGNAPRCEPTNPRLKMLSAALHANHTAATSTFLATVTASAFRDLPPPCANAAFEPPESAPPCRPSALRATRCLRQRCSLSATARSREKRLRATKRRAKRCSVTAASRSRAAAAAAASLLACGDSDDSCGGWPSATAMATVARTSECARPRCQANTTDAPAAATERET